MLLKYLLCNKKKIKKHISIIAKYIQNTDLVFNNNSTDLDDHASLSSRIFV